MQDPEPVRRTSEIEDATNLYFIHPLANRLTPWLAGMRVPANAVSVAGMAFGILAGLAYSRYQDPRWAIAGFLLMIAWHVMDGTDGQLARLTRSQSESGKVLDGICDYVTFTAVYAGLAWALSREHGGWVWIVVALAGICHAVQSASYEAQRQEYDSWAWDRNSRQPPSGAPPRDTQPPSAVPRLSGLLHRLYARVQFLAAGSGADFRRGLAETMALRPASAASVRRRYRDVFAAPVRRWSVLSANTRTLGIFLCALLGAPLAYFAFEIVGLGVVLVVLTRRQHARQASFLRDLDAVR